MKLKGALVIVKERLKDWTFYYGLRDKDPRFSIFFGIYITELFDASFSMHSMISEYFIFGRKT